MTPARERLCAHVNSCVTCANEAVREMCGLGDTLTRVADDVDAQEAELDVDATLVPVDTMVSMTPRGRLVSVQDGDQDGA